MNNAATFRSERFIDKDRSSMSLTKIGEHVKTPLYNPSMRAMLLPLSEVRKQLELDRKADEALDRAWKAAAKMYQMRATYFKERFLGPEEYCIALICFTLDQPYKIYDNFNRLCHQLMTNTWVDFPYKGLLYLIIQAELRMKSVKEDKLPPKTVRYPITITTDLDYKLEEAEESNVMYMSQEISPTESDPMTSKSLPAMLLSPTTSTVHGLTPLPTYRVYRAFDFAVDDLEFLPRNLVTFTSLLSTTLHGPRLAQILEEKSREGRRVTLLEIDQLSWSARNISPISVFPMEKEVLIWPWIKFYVEDRKMISRNVEKIVLIPTSHSFR